MFYYMFSELDWDMVDFLYDQYSSYNDFEECSYFQYEDDQIVVF